MADDGFHEIQLNGKQLVFLFMATTVVAVVIFLSGVMVGRGVRSDKAASAPNDALALAPAAAPPLEPSSPAPPAAGGAETASRPNPETFRQGTALASADAAVEGGSKRWIGRPCRSSGCPFSFSSS